MRPRGGRAATVTFRRMSGIIPVMAGKPFIPSWSELRPLAAELWLVATIVVGLLAPFRGGRSNLLSGLIALGGLAAALCAVLLGADAPGSALLRGMLTVDRFAVAWKVIVLVFAAGVVLMWFVTTSATMRPGDGPEFFTLLIGATLGMCLMGSTSNLLMVFMTMELASLPSYVLAGFRKTDRLGSEAALKYVLFGAATSATMLFGMSLLYGLFGSLQLEEIARNAGKAAGSVPFIVGLGAVVAGVGFKISAVPLHFWCPDVFEGASIEVSAFLSVASKGAGLVLFSRILAAFAGAGEAGSTPAAALALVAGILGAVTATVGNTGAFVQNNIKRLLAYSSIAHAGYMLCIMAVMSAGGRTQTAAQALLVYLAVYLVMNLGAFLVAGLVYRHAGSENIEDYAGLGWRSPILAACMAAFMFSLIGLPPLAGFAAKMNVLYVLGQTGGWAWALAAVVVINTVFSAYYYARVLRAMYLIKADDRPALRVGVLGTGLSVACAGALVLMLAAFGPLLKATARHGQLGGAPVGVVR